MEASQDQPAIERAAPVAAARSQERAGGQALSVLAVPLNLQVLQALSARPMRLGELRKATGLPAQTTLRGHLASLSDIGMLRKEPTDRVPYAVENALTSMGEEMLFVASRLEAWLLQAPDGPIALESGSAKGAVKALVDGWDSRMLGILAERPMSLTELDREIPELSYPSLERRLSSMRIAGLVEPCEGSGAGTPYRVTEWARRGVAPLVAAGHCERVHLSRQSTPLTTVDIEAALMLALPLVRLPEELSGECQVEVRASPGLVAESTGMRVVLDRGQVASCATGLDGDAPSHVSGSAMDWFDAIKGGEPDRLDLSPGQLPAALVNGLSVAFGGRGRALA
ncbi:MAG TPA: winged helix-turn-helix transcriptional regulator [Solirubrobacterales bacterium]|nr:winged helix-turn-helix transcriptional regulator [Solirubrobacterales bacterium]